MLLKSLAHPTGFEPVTSAFGGHWVNKISQRYQTVTVSQGDCIGFVNALRLGMYLKMARFKDLGNSVLLVI